MSSDNEMRVKSLLTNREREVFELLVQDKTTKEIAAQLFVSEKTVRNHISNVIWMGLLKSNQEKRGERTLEARFPRSFGLHSSLEV